MEYWKSQALMQGIIYTRVSSEEQIAGTSLASQEALCRRYCEERRIGVLEVFREEGESAKTADRTALLQAIEFCRKQCGIVQAFVVAKVDRLARNTEDHFYIRKLLADNGVQLHSVTEPIGNSPTEKFVETMLAASAEFDNAIRKQRCTEGMVSRIKQGIWPFRVPLGYICARHRSRGEKKTRPDEPDPKIFAIVQRALLSYADGELRSLSEFRCHLDELGLAALRGRPTKLQLVDRILGHYLPFYAGVLVNPWTRAVHQGQHVAMISTQDAERIRLVRLGRHRPASVRKDRFNPLFPLRRTVRCAVCRGPLTGAVSRGNGGQYAYYFCRRTACRRRTKQFRREALHAAFDSFIKQITPCHRYLNVLEAQIRELLAERSSRFRDTAATTERGVAELERKRSRIFDMREDGSYSQELFTERLQAVDSQLTALKLQGNRNHTHDLTPDAAIAALRWLCRTVPGLRRDVPAIMRPRFEQFVLPEGVVFDREAGVRTSKLGLVFQLYRQNHVHDSPNVDLRGDSSNQLCLYLSDLIDCHRSFAGVDHLTSDDVKHGHVPNIPMSTPKKRALS